MHRFSKIGNYFSGAKAVLFACTQPQSARLASSQTSFMTRPEHPSPREFTSAEDHAGSLHWEPAHTAEEYEGMTLHVLCLRAEGVFAVFCEDLQGELREGDTKAEALRAFLVAVDDRATSDNGGLFIQPSSFVYQLQCLRAFHATYCNSNETYEWDTLTQHTLQYNSADFL